MALIALCAGVPERVRAQLPIVYSRCARTRAEAVVTGDVVIGGVRETRSRTLRHFDSGDMLPDVQAFQGGFNAPCDLMFRDADGTSRVLYDCSSTATEDETCAALDPSVSFDGRTVAVAVFRGPMSPGIFANVRYRASVLDPLAENADEYAIPNPNRYLMSRDARIVLVDIATGEVTDLPHEEGVFDSGPAWLSSGRIAFTSTRRGVYATSIGGRRPLAPQIHTMDPDGRNVEVASYHALGGEQHPLQLHDGRVAYSSWQLFGALPYRATNGSAGGFQTLPNLFHIYAQNPDGAVQFALFGQHLTKYHSSAGFPIHAAAHFIGQSGDGRLWITDYYRGNNLGMGTIVGFPLQPLGIEGVHPDDTVGSGDFYRPEGFAVLTPWSHNGDGWARRMGEPEMTVSHYADPLVFAGKARDPSASLDGQLLVSWGKGQCSTQPGPPQPEAPPPGQGGNQTFLEWLGVDNPACDAGIYVTTRIPSVHPSDLQVVVDEPEWHEIMPRAAVPYAAMFGIESPPDLARAEDLGAGNPYLPRGTPFGILGASSILLRETRPRDGYHFQGEQQWGLQGTDAVDYADDELCGIRILGVQPNSSDREWLLGEGMSMVPGERTVIMGEFPVRRSGGALDPLGMPETSFQVRFPANTPYLMQAIDCDGRTLNSDQTWQHLRPGEVRTCAGCHVHSRPGLPFEDTAAAAADYVPFTLGEGSVPLLAGGSGADVAVVEHSGFGIAVEYERDIVPIFSSRCARCHSGDGAAAGLRLDVPGRGAGSTYHCLVVDNGQACVPEGARPAGVLRKPQLTRYMRMLNARGSLLYWKAANERTDGRTDEQYDETSPRGWEDVDFGPAHPTDITAEELGLLARWIETGAGAGAPYLMDTTAPVLTMVADVEERALVRIRVGAADVPSGIDAASLEVCVLDEAGGCGPNLAAAVTERDAIRVIEFSSPLSDPDLEIRAQIQDLEGNRTELRRTVGWFLGLSPSPAPSDSDGSRTDGGASSSGRPTVVGGCGCALIGGGRWDGSLRSDAVLAFAVLVFGCWIRAARRRVIARRRRQAAGR